jgi:hypothetical protein
LELIEATQELEEEHRQLNIKHQAAHSMILELRRLKHVKGDTGEVAVLMREIS